MNKAEFNFEGDELEISLPIVKVDEEARTVSGFATLNNSDAHNDILTADASKKAFQRWRGNVREMHQPLAVGKALDFKEEEFFDEKTQQMYRGIFVSVYVSKGAEDTWQKVLDGTLTGFSVGGKALEKEHYEDENGNKGRKILDYELKELSLVDSPANKLANIMSIQKDDNGNEFVEGIAASVKTQNVYYCKDEGFAFTTENEIESCRSCGENLKNLGWVEDSVDKHASVMDLVKSIRASDGSWTIKSNGYADFYSVTYPDSSSNININVTSSDFDKQGGVNMTAKTEEKTEKTEEVDNEVDKSEGSEETAADVEETETDNSTEKSEKAAEVDETDTDEADLGKSIEELKTTLEDGLNKAVKAAESAQEAANSAKEDVDSKVSKLSEEVESLKTELGGVKDKVSKFEDGGAVRKSSEVEADEDDEEEGSFWRGQFLDAESLRS